MYLTKHGLMRIIIFTLLILVLLQTQVIAQESFYISIKLNTFDSPDSAFEVPVSYSVFSSSDEKTIAGRVLSDENGYITLNLLSGFNDLKISVDLVETEGFDFYGEKLLSVDESTGDDSIDLFPVGSATLSVVDKRDFLITEAAVRIDCTKSYGVQGYFRTDKFGIVSADYLPTGNCVFRSAVDEHVVSSNLEITQGSKQEITLKFENYSQKDNGWLFILILFIIFILIVGYFVFFKKKSAVGKEVVKEISETIVSDTTEVKDDIITTLGNKEGQVAKFLLEEREKYVDEGKPAKNFYVSQATIVRGLQMPKTSLTRVLESLKNKKIVNIEKIGKLKKISFSEWFNSK